MNANSKLEVSFQIVNEACMLFQNLMHTLYLIFHLVIIFYEIFKILYAISFLWKLLLLELCHRLVSCILFV